MTKFNKAACSMQKKIESFKKNESAAGRSFYDEFIADRAREILEEYDVNEAQGGMCDYWYNIGDGVEDMERDNRSGFFSYNDGGVQKTWMTTPFMLAGGGYLDPKTEPEYDRLRKNCEDDYREECEKNGVECDFSSEEYYEFEDTWSSEGLEIFAYAEIMLYSRNSDRDEYTLIARISRSFDYTYGRNPQDDLNIEMDLTSEQFTKENADKFFAAVEEAFANYSFSQGDKEINVKEE